MRVCIRGIRQLDFTTPDGEVKRTQIFFSHPSEGVTGEKTDKIFVRQGFALPADLAPGRQCDIYCDTKGHVEYVQLVAATASK